jgi:hypothetical protein
MPNTRPAKQPDLKAKLPVYQELTELLIKILENPETPTRLYNDMSDALMDIFNTAKAADPFNPNIMRVWLPLSLLELEQREQARKGLQV